MTKLRGEWWIEDSSVMWADRDVGDSGHMEHVLDHVSGEFLDALREHPVFYNLWPDLQFLEQAYDLGMLCETINNWADREHGDGRLPEEVTENTYSWLAEQISWSEEKLAILIGHDIDGDRDPRNYAIKHLGWVKVAQNTLACWTLDHTTLRRITRGLDEILQDFDGNTDELLFDITTHCDDVAYYDVPLALIDGAEAETIIRRHRRGVSNNLTVQPGPEPIA